MADPASPPPVERPETSRGLPGAIGGLLGSLGHHVQTLIALAGEESKEAAIHYLILAILLVTGLVFALFGYVLLLLFLAFLLAMVTGISWLWICLGLAGLHLLGAIICALILKARLAAPVFAATSVELKKDFDALQRFQP
jgi:uncharacterized membrane protein YqjE